MMTVEHRAENLRDLGFLRSFCTSVWAPSFGPARGRGPLQRPAETCRAWTSWCCLSLKGGSDQERPRCRASTARFLRSCSVFQPALPSWVASCQGRARPDASVAPEGRLRGRSARPGRVRCPWSSSFPSSVSLAGVLGARAPAGPHGGVLSPVLRFHGENTQHLECSREGNREERMLRAATPLGWGVYRRPLQRQVRP